MATTKRTAVRRGSTKSKAGERFFGAVDNVEDIVDFVSQRLWEMTR